MKQDIIIWKNYFLSFHTQNVPVFFLLLRFIPFSADSYVY